MSGCLQSGMCEVKPMKAFCIKIAGLVTRVEPMFESTALYSRNYLCEEEPDFSVSVTQEDLQLVQDMLDNEAREEGMKLRKFTDPFLERTAIQWKIADELILRGTLLLHGSTVGLDGGAYLFTATCGTGKSTHTRLWREAFGERAVMVNDDKPFLQITSTGVTAHGAPWSGKHGLDTNISLPLKGICILRRGPENEIKRITPEEAMPMLRHQSHNPADPRAQQEVASLLKKLAETVPLWEMHCTKSIDAAYVSYHAMSGSRREDHEFSV